MGYNQMKIESVFHMNSPIVEAGACHMCFKNDFYYSTVYSYFHTPNKLSIIS